MSSFLQKWAQFRPLFVYFRSFLVKISIIQIEKAQMVRLGFQPRAAGWQAQTKPAMTAACRYFYVQDWAQIKPPQISLNMISALITNLSIFPGVCQNQNKPPSTKILVGRQWQCDQIGQFLHFVQLFKACGNNYFAQIAHT